MEQNIKVNGGMVLEMVMGYKYGQMEVDMKDFGVEIKLMVKVNWSMLMVISMKDNGKMIKHMEKEHFYMSMELIIMVIGLMINKME